MKSSIYRTENMKEVYKLENIVGEGSFAVVKKGTKKSNNQDYAIKIIDKTALESDDQLSLQTEVEIMSQIDHPNIVKIYEVYDDKTRFNMVMELMKGGELLERITEKESYSEKDAADTIRPVVDALRYCHSMGIAHRDLKPENLLYESTNPSSVLKIADFGLSKVMNDDLMKTAVGTPGYVAPEIIEKKPYDETVDCWSLGVILYVMLCGYLPFSEDSIERLNEKITKGDYDFPSKDWDQISDLAKDLIKKLLVVDPKKRLSSEQILQHPWIVGDKTPREKLTKVTENIRHLNAIRKLKRKALMVMAANKWRQLVKIEN